MHIQFETVISNTFTCQDQAAIVNYYAHNEYTDCGRYKYWEIEIGSVQFFVDGVLQYSNDYDDEEVLRRCEKHFEDESRDLEAEYLLNRMEVCYDT